MNRAAGGFGLLLAALLVGWWLRPSAPPVESAPPPDPGAVEVVGPEALVGPLPPGSRPVGRLTRQTTLHGVSVTGLFVCDLTVAAAAEFFQQTWPDATRRDEPDGRAVVFTRRAGDLTTSLRLSAEGAGCRFQVLESRVAAPPADVLE